jgi:hypothetical protein
VDIDYYLERISIKLANLFGVFYNVVLFLFVSIVFCSFILWLIVPMIELRKKALLKKIYEQLVETQELVYSIKRDLANPAGNRVKNFSEERND